MLGKKILHIILRLSGGGVEKQLFNLSLAQKKYGYDVNIIVYHWCKNCEKLSNFGIKIYHIKSYKYYSLKSVYSLYQYQKEINPQLSISWTPTIDFFVFICSSLNKTLFVVNERTSWLCYEKFSLINFKGELIKTSITHNYIIFRLTNLLRFFSLKFSAAIIVNSKHMQKYYERKFFTKKIFQINNIVNTSNNKIKNYLNDSLTFLVVSRFVESKNIDLVLESFKLIRNKYKVSKLVIIGQGYNTNNLLKIIDSKIKKHVKVIPKLENWSNKFNKKKTYLVHPSFYEGQPNVVLEAASSKLPIIISKIPAHTDIFSKNSCIYFDPFNLNDLYSKMTLCLKESKTIRNKRVNFAEKKLRLFSIKSAMNKYNKFLNFF